VWGRERIGLVGLRTWRRSLAGVALDSDRRPNSITIRRGMVGNLTEGKTGHQRSASASVPSTPGAGSSSPFASIRNQLTGLDDLVLATVLKLPQQPTSSTGTSTLTLRLSLDRFISAHGRADRRARSSRTQLPRNPSRSKPLRSTSGASSQSQAGSSSPRTPPRRKLVPAVCQERWRSGTGSLSSHANLLLILHAE
jgi:hypothetical protein